MSKKMRWVTGLLVVCNLLVPVSLFSEQQPEGTEQVEAEAAPHSEAPVFYEKYLPGYKMQPVEENVEEPTEIDTGEEQTVVEENTENGFEIDTSFWKNRNFVNLLIFLAIAVVFVIYRVRSGGRKRGI